MGTVPLSFISSVFHIIDNDRFGFVVLCDSGSALGSYRTRELAEAAIATFTHHRKKGA